MAVWERRLTINTVWNLTGLWVPLSVAAIAMPLLMREIGTERLGLLALAWALLGYFGILDLGIPRALTKIVAEQSGVYSPREISSSIWTALWVLAAVGIGGGILFVVWMPFLARWLNISEELRREVVQSGIVLGIAIPATVLSAGLRGILEGRGKFGLVAAIRVPVGALTYLAPLVTSWYSHEFQELAASLLVARVLTLLATAVCCYTAVPECRIVAPINASRLKNLLSFGGWLTAGNLIGQIMAYADRLILAIAVPAGTLAFYAVPAEINGKLLLIPAALSAALFPICCTAFSRGEQVGNLYRRVLSVMAVAFAPLAALLVMSAHPLLYHWLGVDFADHGAAPLRLLAVGMFFNALAHVPVTFLHGAGKPRLTTIVTLIELAPYIALLYWAAMNHGIAGAAAVWAARALVDLLVLSAAATAVNDIRRPLDARPAAAT